MSISATTILVNSQDTLITIKVATQLPHKLTTVNYLSWRAQFYALLIGLDLTGYIDDKIPCLPSTLTTGETISPNPAHFLWLRQDSLLFHAILASVSESLVSLISSSKTSSEAWNNLALYFANKSCSRVMHLKEKFCELTATIRTCENLIAFEELHEKLLDFDSLFKKEASSELSIITANVQYQFCDRFGHTAKNCFKITKNARVPYANATIASNASSSPWLADSAASHHVTSDFSNLSVYSEYIGPDEILIDDGSGEGSQYGGFTHSRQE
ncbi:uncharacterized protein LOC110624189 [Manihot esculenta]|uniref:uncharacterized protein LOC110624189 n=1 Tax=Manihot esculenta TaxID=3983 RepID=UPI000B5D70A9|nr:uncharacterized protein LOC110624189 [Manihot esculenta]